MARDAKWDSDTQVSNCHCGASFDIWSFVIWRMRNPIGLSVLLLHPGVLWPDVSGRLRFKASDKVKIVFTDWCQTSRGKATHLDVVIIIGISSHTVLLFSFALFSAAPVCFLPPEIRKLIRCDWHFGDKFDKLCTF